MICFIYHSSNNLLTPYHFLQHSGQRALTAQLAALSEDIDTKARLIEQLEVSQRRLAALRTHYEQRLDTLHHQIKATNDERDKVLASLCECI